MKLTLTRLPKVSLNEWYAGKHWSKRKQLKDTYEFIILSQTKEIFEGKFNTAYTFYFASKPLDASNCVAMVKMIEDILFSKDGYKDVTSLNIKSRKSETGYDYVEIEIL